MVGRQTGVKRGSTVAQSRLNRSPLDRSGKFPISRCGRIQPPFLPAYRTFVIMPILALRIVCFSNATSRPSGETSK